MTRSKPRDVLVGASHEASPPARPSPPSTRAVARRHDLQILRSLRRIIRAIDQRSKKLSAEHKITVPQLVCLLAIEQHEPITGSAIARHVHLSPSTVNGILDRLEAKELVRRQRDLEDRRRVKLSLTEGGRDLVASAPSPLQETLAEAMNALPEAELAAIAGALDRIVELMEVGNEGAAPILQTGPIATDAGADKAASTLPGDARIEPGPTSRSTAVAGGPDGMS